MKRFMWSALAIGLLACGDDDGPMVAPGDDGGGEDANVANADAGGDAAVASCGALTGRTAECTTCLTENCCSELAACGSDLHCGALVECLRGCEADASPSCMSDCVGVHGVPASYNPLLLCGAADCETECPFSSP